jgi:hypothetical protein
MKKSRTIRKVPVRSTGSGSHRPARRRARRLRSPTEGAGRGAGVVRTSLMPTFSGLP